MTRNEIIDKYTKGILTTSILAHHDHSNNVFVAFVDKNGKPQGYGEYDPNTNIIHSCHPNKKPAIKKIKADEYSDLVL